MPLFIPDPRRPAGGCPVAVKISQRKDGEFLGVQGRFRMNSEKSGGKYKEVLFVFPEKFFPLPNLTLTPTIQSDQHLWIKDYGLKCAEKSRAIPDSAFY